MIQFLLIDLLCCCQCIINFSGVTFGISTVETGIRGIIIKYYFNEVVYDTGGMLFTPTKVFIHPSCGTRALVPKLPGKLITIRTYKKKKKNNTR